jgi:adenosylcobinamide-GDP ribazoletransferase
MSRAVGGRGMSRALAAVAGARAALGLLTIVPAGRAPIDAEARRAAPAWFPVVGGLVGAAAAGVWVLVEPLLGTPYATALALTISAIAAGALHHDGLADSADGLGARGGGPERRLAAMRDPGIGAYGALALIAFALLSLTAIAQLTPAKAAAALVTGHVLGRWSTVPQLAVLAAARQGGLGASFSAPPVAVAVATGSAAVIALVICGIAPAAAALAAAALAAAAVAAVAQLTLGGRTGDTLGASVLVTEVVVYSVLGAYWAG